MAELAKTTTQMKAWELVRKGWCQGVFAMDADNNKVLSTDPFAVKWCILGAIFRCYPGCHSGTGMATAKVLEVLGVLQRENRCFIDSLSIWNDHPHRTQAEVVELLRRLDI